jgi:2-amino-4-deoxychorismate synthase
VSPADLLRGVLGPEPPPFALLYRPHTTGADRLDILVGDVSTPPTLAELPLPGGPADQVLVLVPYQQVRERGFVAVADGSPLVAMRVTAHVTADLAEVLAMLPTGPVAVTGGQFDVDDDRYAATVRAVVDDEIGGGEGSNFVLKRTYVADITDYHTGRALTFFRRLCEGETGAYWTFLVHTGSRTFVGASPERHVSLHDGVVVMNPISGTYRYPSTGPTLPGVLDFLADVKERDELYMVVDEELKMMARICADGIRVVGPWLKEMARLAHTEYLIEGRSDLDPRTILRETLFAPTVTGSPLESACRVISRHEPQGRGYYAGVAALVGQPEPGRWSLDSAILIRTADIDGAGRMRIAVGATVVRHSDPASEVAETTAKVAGLLGVLDTAPSGPLGRHPRVQAELDRRNTGLAPFWLSDTTSGRPVVPALVGRRVLVVDAEDTFTAMIAHQLRSLGLAVTVRRFDEPDDRDGYDLVVMGPGPGDPRDLGDPRIAGLHAQIASLLARRRPFVAVCLSHQVLSARLGLPLVRCRRSNQGRQREIDLFGDPETVGLYNTFAAHCEDDKLDLTGVGLVEVSHDVDTGEVFALRGPHFASMQFHAESVLTRGGPRIFAHRIREVLGL